MSNPDLANRRCLCALGLRTAYLGMVPSNVTGPGFDAFKPPVCPLFGHSAGHAKFHLACLENTKRLGTANARAEYLKTVYKKVKVYHLEFA